MLSCSDHEKLLHFIEDESVAFIADTRNVEMLRRRLDTALVVPKERLPDSAVRLNCQVTLLDVSTEDADLFTLVDPTAADIARGKLSTLSPLGLAILGRHQGQTVRVNVPSGTRTVRIDCVGHQCKPKAMSTTVGSVAGP